MKTLKIINNPTDVLICETNSYCRINLRSKFILSSQLCWRSLASCAGVAEENLWYSVLEQACQDLAIDVTLYKAGTSLRQEAEEALHDARYWLKSSDFFEVCRLAGITHAARLQKRLMLIGDK